MVHVVIRNYLKEDDRLVVGISGGGDSNALLHGLTTFSDFKFHIIPVMIKGIPEWDEGVPRAEELCRKYGIELKVYSEDQVKGLVGAKAGGKSFSDLFEEIFPEEDFDSFGTLLIRLSLIEEAKNTNAKFICTGANLEDLLGEALHQVCNGEELVGIPTRLATDEIRAVFPLWMAPKKIIDGCFQKFSLSNYETRYPGFSYGRSLYYQMAYSIQSSFPGMAERMLRGFAGIADAEKMPVYDEALGFFAFGPVSLNLREKVFTNSERVI